MIEDDPCCPPAQPELLLTPIPAAPGARRDLLVFAEPTDDEGDEASAGMSVNGEFVAFTYRRATPLLRLPKRDVLSVVVADPVSGLSDGFRVLPTSLLTPEELLRPVSDAVDTLAKRGALDPCASRYVGHQVDSMLCAFSRGEAGEALCMASGLDEYLGLIGASLASPTQEYLAGLTRLVLRPGALLASIIVLDKATIDGLSNEQRELYAKLLVAQLNREIKKLQTAGVNNTRLANLIKTRSLLVGSAGLPAVLKLALKRATTLAQLQKLSDSIADAMDRGVELALVLIASAGAALATGIEVLVVLRSFLLCLGRAKKVKKALRKKAGDAAGAIKAVLAAREKFDAAKTPAQKAAAKKALDAAIKKSSALLKSL